MKLADADEYVDNFIKEYGGQFATQDVNGRMVIGGANGQDATRAEVFAKEWKDKYRLAFDFYNANIKSVSDLQNKMGGDRKLLSEGVAMMLTSDRAQAKVKELKERGIAEDAPEMIDATERYTKAHDYGQKIMSGAVYGHYKAVNLVNNMYNGRKIDTKMSNEKWDEYVKARGKVQVDNTFLGKVRSITQKQTEVTPHLEQYEKNLKEGQQHQEGVYSQLKKYQASDEQVGKLDINAHFDSFVSDVKEISSNGNIMNENTLDILKSKIGDARERAINTLIHRVDSEVDLSDIGYLEKLQMLKKADMTASEAALVEGETAFSFPDTEEVEEDFKADYITNRNEKWKGKNYPIAHTLKSNAQIAKKIKDFELTFPIEHSNTLKKRYGTDEHPTVGISNELDRLDVELTKESPTINEDDTTALANLLDELDSQAPALEILQAASGLKDEYLHKSLGITKPYTKDEAATIFKRINDLKKRIKDIRGKAAHFLDARTMELEHLEKGLIEIKQYVLPKLLQDYGYTINPKTPKELIEAETLFTENLLKDPGAIWKSGTQFRQLIANQEDFKDGHNTGVSPRTVTDSDSLFSLSLRKFDLEHFKNPKPDLKGRNYDTPSFRKHFMLNYLQSLAGIHSSMFNQLSQVTFDGGIRGGVSIEQLMVLKHVLNWSISATNPHIRETQRRIANYLKTESKTAGHSDWDKGELHKDNSKVYLYLLWDELDQGTKDKIKGESNYTKRIDLLEVAVKNLAPAKKKEAQRLLNEMISVGKNPYPTPLEMRTNKQEFFIDNGIMIQGNQGSGKTRTSTIILEMLMKLEGMNISVGGQNLQFYDPANPVIVVHSTDLIGTFEKQFADLNKRLGATNKSNPDIILKEHFFANLNDYKGKTVIIDESTLLDREQRTALSEQSKENGDKYQNIYLFLGDRFQTIEETVKTNQSAKSYWQLNQYVVSTHNITQVFRSGQDQVIQQMKSNVEGLSSQRRSNEVMPFGEAKFWHSKDGTKRKGMWVTENYSELKEHLKKRLDAGKLDNLAIVVASQKEGRELLSWYLGIDKSAVDFDSELGKKVFFL